MNLLSVSKLTLKLYLSLGLDIPEAKLEPVVEPVVVVLILTYPLNSGSLLLLILVTQATTRPCSLISVVSKSCRSLRGASAEAAGFAEYHTQRLDQEKQIYQEVLKT